MDNLGKLSWTARKCDESHHRGVSHDCHMTAHMMRKAGLAMHTPHRMARISSSSTTATRHRYPITTQCLRIERGRVKGEGRRV